ncbi:hypothetical protein [Echinicola sp. 20G]|nr:hypothetical protein [Echinicola sp. 20G]
MKYEAGSLKPAWRQTGRKFSTVRNEELESGISNACDLWGQIANLDQH